MKKLVFIMLAILMLSACKTTTKIVEVPVEVVKKEYIHNTKIDSVYIRDSIDRWQKGDTLFITKYSTKYKYLNRVDTILKVDTIPKIISTTIEKKVEVNPKSILFRRISVSYLPYRHRCGNVVYSLRVTTYNPESWVEVDITEYNEWKLKQEEEERKLAEQYGMPYKEEDSIK